MAVELTPSQIAALEEDLVSKKNSRESLINTQTTYPDQVANQKEIDDSFKAVFDFYDSIIVSYEDERSALDGMYVEFPIIEQDIVNAGSLLGGRIMPNNPITDVIRISEFDHSPLINTLTIENNETYYILAQEISETRLQSGYGGSSPSGLSEDIITTSPVSTSSTNVSLELVAMSMSPEATFSIGNIFVLADGGNSLVVEVTGGSALTTSPYSLDIDVLGSSGSAGVGSLVGGMSGFNNTERTNKVANSVNLFGTNVSYQNVMDSLISDLEGNLNGRITNLLLQNTAVSNNQDQDLDPNAIIDIQTSNTFIDNYLLTTDISDTGITILSAERVSRSSEASDRVIAILDSFTMGTINYLDSRYTSANDRANTSRGSMRVLKFLEGVNNNFATKISDLDAAIASIESLLNCL